MASTFEDEFKPIRTYPPRSYPQPQPQPQPYPSHPPPPFKAYAPPYPAYPNPNSPPPPPLAAYNYASSKNFPTGHPNQPQGHNFACVMFLLMLVLILGTSALSLLTWLAFGSDIPTFHLESLKMPTFNITNMMLNAKWEANMSVKNPNSKLKVSFDNIESTLVYKDYLLDTSLAEPFEIGSNETKSLQAKFEMPRSGLNITGGVWVKEMGNEKKEGAVAFDLSIRLRALFTYDSSWRKQMSFRIVCEDLEVYRPGSTGDGIWSGGGNFKDCIVFT